MLRLVFVYNYDIEIYNVQDTRSVREYVIDLVDIAANEVLKAVKKKEYLKRGLYREVT